MVKAKGAHFLCKDLVKAWSWKVGILNHSIDFKVYKFCCGTCQISDWWDNSKPISHGFEAFWSFTRFWNVPQFQVHDVQLSQLTHWGRVTHICVIQWSMVQIMACRLVGAKPLFEPYWNIVNLNLRNKFQWNLKQNSCIFIHEKAFENVVCKISAILSGPHVLTVPTFPSRSIGYPNISLWSFAPATFQEMLWQFQRLLSNSTIPDQKWMGFNVVKSFIWLVQPLHLSSIHRVAEMFIPYKVTKQTSSSSVVIKQSLWWLSYISNVHILKSLWTQASKNIIEFWSDKLKITRHYFGMNPKVGGSSRLRSRHFLSQKLWHFHKNTRSCVENECCCPCS